MAAEAVGQDIVMGDADLGTTHTEEEDDFKDSMTQVTHRQSENVKKESYTSVNYKVSTEKYEKVDLFKMSSSVEETSSEVHSQLRSEFKQSKEESSLTEKNHCTIKSHVTKEESSAYSKTTKSSETVTVSTDGVHTLSDRVMEADITTGAGGDNGLTETDLLRMASDRHRKDPADQLLRAKAEWDAVETIQPGKHAQVIATPLISFNEALAHYQRQDMTTQLKNIKPTVNRSGVAALKHWLVGPPRMNRSLHEERNLVFAIALCPLDDNEPIHKRVLQTIYRQLTGSSIDCPRYGSHWEQIGFQGTDPGTDLRACGFLGLMTLLHFVTDTQQLPVAREIYKLSINETQNFPFAVMSINLTRIAIQMLREEVLSRECNRRKQVFAVLNDLYASLFHQLHVIWKQQHKTVTDSGLVLKDLETLARKNPRILLRNLEIRLESQSEDKIITSNGDGELDFAGIHELEEKQG